MWRWACSTSATRHIILESWVYVYVYVYGGVLVVGRGGARRARRYARLGGASVWTIMSDMG